MSFLEMKFNSNIDRYKKWRRLGMELNKKLIKEIPRGVFLEAAENLRMIGKGGIIVSDSEDELSYIMDRAINDIMIEDKRCIELYIDQYGESSTNNEKMLLNAMKDSYYSLFIVEGIIADKGLQLIDVFSNEKLFSLDINLSQTAEIGYLITSRVISIDNINFTSGCACIFEEKYLKQLKDNFINLFEKKKDTMTWQEMMRKYNPYFFKMMRQLGVDINFSTVIEKGYFANKNRRRLNGNGKSGQN